MGFLGVGSDDGSKGVAQQLKLSLGSGVEKGKFGDVDGVGGVVGVDNDTSADCLALARVADANVSKVVSQKVLSVSKIGLLFGTAKTFSTLSLGLILLIGLLFQGLGTSFLVLLDTLGLGLLGASFGSSLGLGFSSLLFLLALCLRVLGGIP